VTLRLPPGSVLQEEELMEELGLGRTPLREGIKRLALEHLLEIRPRRLTRVTGVSAADAARIGEVRVELEPQAAAIALGGANAADLLHDPGEHLRREE
jgi:DNA-binding GntR family transcriptional regulator